MRRPGCSAIDVARNEMASEALHDGAESVLFIYSDIGFEPADALRVLGRSEPVSRRWPTRRSGSGITAVTPSAKRMPGQTVPATRRSSTGSGDLDNPRAREPCVEDSAD